MVNTEGEDILGPTFPDNTHILDNYVCAGVKQIFNGIVTPNDSNANKNNIPVTYKIYDGNNTLLNTINTTTNNTGGHELQYTFPHKGNYNIIASVGDDTISLPVSVESLVDQITLSSSSNSVIQGNNVTLIAEVRSSTGDIVVGADVIFKITENIDSFTEEKSINDYFELDYDIHLPKINLECNLKGQLGVSIIPKNSSTESQILQIGSNSYQTLRIVDDGNSLKYYLDNVLQGTLSTGIKKLYIWGEGGTVKELTFTGNDTVTAPSTTNSGGTSVNYTYPGGTCNVKAIASYGIDSNESSSITITESPALFDEITVTSDKDIISYNGGNNPESATLSAQLKKNGANANVSGQTVTFEVRKVSDDSLVETLTGSTNSSGLASVSYYGKGAGDIYIKAECRLVSKRYEVSDRLFYDDTTTDKSSKYVSRNVGNGKSCTISYANNEYHLTATGSGVSWYGISPISVSTSDNWEITSMIKVVQSGIDSQFVSFGLADGGANHIEHILYPRNNPTSYAVYGYGSPNSYVIPNANCSLTTNTYYTFKITLIDGEVSFKVYNGETLIIDRTYTLPSNYENIDVYPVVSCFGNTNNNNTSTYFKEYSVKPL